MSHNWKKVLISPDATLEEAISVIDQEALRIALVVDESNRLQGTVSDGDIRRALIKHRPLSSRVREVMNSKPTVAELSTPRETLRSIMYYNDLLSIPLLSDGVVVGLESLHQVMEDYRYENPVFLMAGGFGTRLRPLTNNCPKPLLRIGEKPILEIILESFVAVGFHNFYISTHYKPEMIRDYFGDGSKWGVKITYVHELEPLGTAGALGLLPRDLPDLPLIVMNGDILTKVDFKNLLKYHNENSSLATMCVREYHHQIPYGVIFADDHKITSIIEKPNQKYFVNAGVYVLDASIIHQVKQNEHIDMPTLLTEYIDKGKPVSMFPLHEYWLDIGQMKDFNQAQSDVEILEK